MPDSNRAFDRGTRRGEHALAALAEELRQARAATGVSQEHVAIAARLSRPRYSKIERAKAVTLTVMETARLASVLGMDLSLRLYPGPEPLRDGAQVTRLRTLLDHVRPPLRWRTEVPLPDVAGRFEQRAWDAVLLNRRERTAIELEMRLRDAQALERRLALKRRDDPTEHFLLVVADTRPNRRVLAEHPELFPDLARLRRSEVLADLRAGGHPRTGLVRI